MKGIWNRIYLCNVKRIWGMRKTHDKEKKHRDADSDGDLDGIKPVYDFRIGRRGWNEVPARDDYRWIEINIGR